MFARKKYRRLQIIPAVVQKNVGANCVRPKYVKELKMELPKRKPNRLREYDYSQNGAYFITICTKDRECVFWNVGANCVRPYELPLSDAGVIAENEIKKIGTIYDGVVIDKFVIMPDHIHLIIKLSGDKDRRTQFAPTASRIIKQFKGAITKQIGRSVWQRSYFDHIIRNQQDYEETWKYIDENPMRWMTKNQTTM